MVWVDGCTFVPTTADAPPDAVLVESCASVLVGRSSISAVRPLIGDGGSAIRAEDSALYVFETTLIGGNGKAVNEFGLRGRREAGRRGETRFA